MVSEKIKLIMKTKGVSNKELAEFLNISPQSLSNKFYRDSYSISELVRILNYLDCDLVISSKPDINIIIKELE